MVSAAKPKNCSKKNRHGILTYFDCYITNALSKYINSKIQIIKANKGRCPAGDGAGFHQDKHLSEVPQNIHLIKRPPYSSELKPIEQLWDQVGAVHANQVYETLDEIEKDITAHFILFRRTQNGYFSY